MTSRFHPVVAGIASLLVVLFSLSHPAPAGSRGLGAAMVICSDGGATTVWLDASGAPVEEPAGVQHCAYCLCHVVFDQPQASPRLAMTQHGQSVVFPAIAALNLPASRALARPARGPPIAATTARVVPTEAAFARLVFSFKRLEPLA